VKLPPSQFSLLLSRSFPSAYYRGTSLTRKQTPLGPHRRLKPRFPGGSHGSGRFLVGEAPLYVFNKGCYRPHSNPNPFICNPG